MVLTPPRRPQDDSGAVVLLVAAMAIVIFAFAALVIDLGHARMERRVAQNAADASALAGGNVLYPSGSSTPDYAAAEAAVKAYATQNYAVTDAEWSTCTDPARLGTIVSTRCISFEVSASGAKVKVVMPTRTRSTSFARVIGIDTIKISAQARANLKVGGASDCGLCILGSGGLHDIQNGDVTVSGGNIHFNGNVHVNANGLVATTGSITVEGSAAGPTGAYQPPPTTGQPPIRDPLADWVERPDLTGLQRYTNPCLSGPGIYGGFNFPNGTCALTPGVYVITGDWSLSGGSTVQAPGVTLFFTCGTSTIPRPCSSPGEVGGTIDNSGNGTLGIQAPTSGPYKGMAVWYDRRNTGLIRMTGNGASGYSGTIYAPSARLLINGNGCGTLIQALIIVKDLSFNGNPACMTSSYSQDDNTDIPAGALHLDQ